LSRRILPAGFFIFFMKTQLVIDHIARWLAEYSQNSKTKGFVIGISGGIDSAVTSVLCAITGKPVLALELPIYQSEKQVQRGLEHIAWLKANFPEVLEQRVELTSTFDQMISALPKISDPQKLSLALANTRARLRMTTLYYFAGLNNMLVAGTGNKVEDFGVGFYTKYGDGGVDLSPIADLTKTEVYEIARHMGIAESILNAPPTDGLWGDDRTDEDQIGASYPELEWAMEYLSKELINENHDTLNVDLLDLSDRKKQVLKIFLTMNRANRHKMIAIPVCVIPLELK
jgi:NAD+ synthase